MIDKDLFKLLGKNKKYVFISLFLQIICMLLNIFVTALICYSIFLAYNKNDLNSYIIPLFLAIISILIRYICSYSNGLVKDKISKEIKIDLRNKVYNKVLSLGVKTTDYMSIAGLTQVSLEGIEQLDLYFSSYIPQFFYAMISPIILFLITVWIDYRVAIVLLLCVPLIPISIVAVSKYAKKIFAKYWGKYTSMGDDFLDSVQGLTELKIFKADARQHKKINESAEEFRKITMKVLIMQLASTTIMDLVAYVGAALGITLAILGAFYFNVNPFASLFLCLVAVEFFLPLRAFGSAFHVAMNGLSAGKKIISLLNEKDPTWGNEKIEDKSILIKDVSFSYNDKKEVLNDINLEFLDKSMSAIVGESGSGKSTIVNLLLRINSPKKGDILIGNKDINTISKDSFYSSIGVISYDSYVFNESIRDNFKIANDNVTDEEIYEALTKVNLKEFVIENGGLDKIINENGSNISGGQKQRLALALSLVSNKDIYIFDEATSNIDIESEAIIMKNIKELSKNKNVIVISHRLENVVNADRIYYLEEGKILESGAHQELIKNNKGYAKLYNFQKALEKGYLKEDK